MRADTRMSGLPVVRYAKRNPSHDSVVLMLIGGDETDKYRLQHEETMASEYTLTRLICYNTPFPIRDTRGEGVS